MRISVFGLGYVGAVCAACLANRGHMVVGIDKSEAKVNAIRAGRSPIIERELNELIVNAVTGGSLTATTNIGLAVRSTDLSLVCVGTPSQGNGALNLTSVETVSTEIGEALRAKLRATTL